MLRKNTSVAETQSLSGRPVSDKKILAVRNATNLWCREKGWGAGAIAKASFAD